MGLLVEGSPLDWEDALEYLEHVRANGIDQFLHIYHRVKDIQGDVLKWGDELEYGIFKLDHESRMPKLSLRGDEILKQLKQLEDKFDRPDNNIDACAWVPEYGAWMVEGTPRVPYGGFTTDLRSVEKNMRLRRARLLNVLQEDEIAPTVTTFPMMGVQDFTFPSTSPNGPVAMSDYVSDDVINPHPRFATLTRNIRKRRTRKVDIRVPIFRDVYTEEMLCGERKKSWNAEKPILNDESSKVSPSNEMNGIEVSVQKSMNLKDKEAEFEHENALKTKEKRSLSHNVEQAERYPGFIHMDCMAFGMGMCCLQVTFQAKNMAESRHLYDHLGVLSPILLALTAATPILKGRLADTDVRWATISASVDDRTPQELGMEELPQDEETRKKYAKMTGGGIKRLPKSRYEGISAYICNHKSGQDPHTITEKYNDVEIPIDEKSYGTLMANGVDKLLAQHISHLFIRDPLVIYRQRLHLDNACETDHFENIQSTNWQTVRWKPPPAPPAPVNSPLTNRSSSLEFTNEVKSGAQDKNQSIPSLPVVTLPFAQALEMNRQSPPRSDSSTASPSDIASPKVDKRPTIPHIGWRTEFRSMEIQLTDFENAAFTVFIALVSRVILTFHLNLYIPLSRVNENMEAAHHVDAVMKEKFYFRSHMAPPEESDCVFAEEGKHCSVHEDVDRCEPMTVAEIMLGKGSYFTGLIPLVYAYLDYIECDEATRKIISKYLCLIEKRATGELPTTATWMRRFVHAHPDYAHDSVISSTIAYDLLVDCQAIGEGLKHCPELLGNFKIEPVRGNAAYQVPLKSDGLEASMCQKLLNRYLRRPINEKETCSTDGTQ